MVTARTRGLNDQVTLWIVTGRDAYDRRTWAAPVVIKGRWEDKNETIRNLAGDEVVSTSRVYLPQPGIIGSYLAYGDQSANADPTKVQGAREVQMTGRQRNLRALSEVNVAYL
jgi:hypothetical protein